MDEILKKYQDQLDQAIKFSEKINRQKSYLVDLLIKDKSPASNVIIRKYLDWLDENEAVKSESIFREPKIGDRVILLDDDESEGVIESLSIAGGARISFDDGCYGNYTRVELITLFAYKESD